MAGETGALDQAAFLESLAETPLNGWQKAKALTDEITAVELSDKSLPDPYASLLSALVRKVSDPIDWAQVFPGTGAGFSVENPGAAGAAPGAANAVSGSGGGEWAKYSFAGEIS